MSLEEGPRKIEKLLPGCKVADFETSKSQPMLLIASTEHKLQSYYLKPSIHPGLASKFLAMASLDIALLPQLFGFSGKKNIVHCQYENLVINNKKEIKQNGKINHLLIDECQVALSSSLDTISINSIEKGTKIGQLHYYGGNITSLFWNNSLAISGDERGLINLWDINKEKIIHSHTFYASKIDTIGSYVDFIHTNFYYSVSTAERKIAFHDLRSHRPIKITPNLPVDIKKVTINKSGKIFLLSNKNIDVIDSYQSFNILGAFNQLSGEKLQDFKIKHPEGQTFERQLTDLLIWNQYVVASCSNGCIEVYNTDTFQCQYAYGMSQNSGLSKLKRVQNGLISLDNKGVLSMVQFS